MISLNGILHFVDHPKLLLLAAILSAPALFPLARFFFDDFSTFKRDVGLDNSVGRFAWLIGWPLEEWTLRYRIAGFAGCYAVVVAAVYQLCVEIGGFFRLGPP
ncbi:MAG: hypothetical protein ISP90_13615 [Nevskia sp.]|nr:hypothetical protein [Nevskia sp.]